MSKQVNKYSSPFDKKARVIGIVMTVLFHCALTFICFGAGLKYIYPPPTEKGILMEFVQDDPKPIEVKTGVEPRAKKADPKQEVRLVQKSEAPEVGTKENITSETVIGDNGDVEKPEPPQPKPIDKRALFSSNAANKDTLAAQTAEKVSNALKAGHSEGNTRVGNPDGTPSAHLQGRTVMGNLPIPSYTVQDAGQVVVKIRVDQYGKVISAIAGVEGTTVQNKVLWNAAKDAALDAKFNVDGKAPATQEGTITYIFKLK